MNKIILFVTHRRSKCGVYEFGQDIFNVLQHSSKYHFIKAECDDLAELQEAIKKHDPAGIIYNYHQSVLPWIATKIGPKLFRNNIASIKVPQIAIIHEVTQKVADDATSYMKKYLPVDVSRLSNSLFNYYIAPDPTLLLFNPIVYKTGRLIPEYNNELSLPIKPVIGSFGFGTPNKGFEKIVERVQEEFDEATIRFNIPFADFGDKDGKGAKAIEAACRSLITKPGIALKVTHDYHDKRSLLDFLTSNTVNVFLYEDTGGRGLSSALDNALAVKRPVAISKSTMFRHLLKTSPTICIPDTSLQNIIQNGTTPLQKYYDEWNARNLKWEYERILDSIFNRYAQTKRRSRITKKIRSFVKSTLALPGGHSSWIKNTDAVNEDDMSVIRENDYQAVSLSATDNFNRILDNEARMLYKPAIEKLFELVPKTMSKKIPEANVQQGFVFDTVYRFIPQFQDPKLLCVGSYEDTASMALSRLGYNITEVDPMLNYYLQEFFTKPTTQKSSFSIIFSTSVIEHDSNDISFVKCINDLLKPGGIAVITCDYKEDWKQGDPKPDVDERFYTQNDLRVRLINNMPDCDLIDEPRWDCPDPDFNFLGKYQYTFATFVVKKKI